jgi:gas vesicle protein
MSATRYWAIFAIGVAAGAAVALAYAPQEGKKTRKQLKKRFDETGDYLKDTADDFTKQAGHYVSKAKDAADDLSKQTSQYASRVRDVAEDFSKTASSVVSKVGSRLSDLT